MSKGRVIADGSILELKKKFGKGYIIRGVDRSNGNKEVEIRCKEEELDGVLS